eukprot:TRINITY_DN4877_c0_g1_i1.p1 TRINITY_DN4877_c0_g1~~TRINITY_DN4877_c0_g1_i1.p1  ORF type:complete len:163 (+),score=32.63 TRINITY_DN4877_c0_g1_i1:94-582(+)
MDDALLPQEASPTRKIVTYGFAGAVTIFVIVTVIIAAIAGAKQYHGGFLLLGIILFTLFASTVLLLYWHKMGRVDDAVQGVAIFQCVVLVLLCVSVFWVLYSKTPAEKCLEQGYLGSDSPLPSPYDDQCFPLPQCFGWPNSCLFWAGGYQCGIWNASSMQCR